MYIYTALPSRGKTEHKYPAPCLDPGKTSKNQGSTIGHTFRVKITSLPSLVSPTFRRKCGSEGSFPSHPHQRAVQFNTTLHKNLNLVILKNEIAVTRSELAECRYSGGNSRLGEGLRPAYPARPPRAQLCADPGCRVPVPLALTLGACDQALGAGSLSLAPDWPHSPHFARFLLSRPLSVPLCLFSLQPSALPSLPPLHTHTHTHLIAPYLVPVTSPLSAAGLQKVTHSRTLRFTPHRPRPKQSLAHCPLFHFLGHFPRSIPPSPSRRAPREYLPVSPTPWPSLSDSFELPVWRGPLSPSSRASSLRVLLSTAGGRASARCSAAPV